MWVGEAVDEGPSPGSQGWGTGQGIGLSTPTFTQMSYKPDVLNSRSYSCPEEVGVTR